MAERCFLGMPFQRLRARSAAALLVMTLILPILRTFNQGFSAMPTFFRFWGFT
jgi:hypothetical protein